MKNYEKETGNSAILNASITNDFKKWLRKEKNYEKDKKRVTILVSEDTKDRWQDFAEERKKKFSTISKLIRKAVDFYIEHESGFVSKKTVSQLSYELKEPLTAIKGYTHLIIENFRDRLDTDILFKIKEVYDQSLIIEKIISDSLEKQITKDSMYEILIVDDEESTNKVLIDFFRFKGYRTKAVSSGSKAFAELKKNTPKIILLDILLPETTGYDLCKKIKSRENLKDVQIFFITAVPRNEVEERISETKANGYFLKPFNFPEFEILFKYLSKT